MQFSLDILAFTFFILIVGRVGVVELAATNIALSINAIAFMPSMGVSHGLAVLVGQALGGKTPGRAVHATWSASHLLLIYIFAVGIMFIVWPEVIIALFIPGGDSSGAYGPVIETGAVLMRIMACYLFFDALYMVFAGVLKGAGDTRFIMWSIAGAATFCFILPLYVGIELLGKGVYFAWGCVLFFILTLFALSAWRYATGCWKSMLVIGSPQGDGIDR
jgi:MATE family multidrug resistance protein